MPLIFKVGYECLYTVYIVLFYAYGTLWKRVGREEVNYGNIFVVYCFQKRLVVVRDNVRYRLYKDSSGARGYYFRESLSFLVVGASCGDTGKVVSDLLKSRLYRTYKFGISLLVLVFYYEEYFIALLLCLI